LRGRADALGLKEVTALVGGNDFETRADSEAEAGDEGIPEAEAVDVFGLRDEEQVAASLVAGEEAVEDGEADG